MSSHLVIVAVSETLAENDRIDAWLAGLTQEQGGDLIRLLLDVPVGDVDIPGDLIEELGGDRAWSASMMVQRLTAEELAYVRGTGPLPRPEPRAPSPYEGPRLSPAEEARWRFAQRLSGMIESDILGPLPVPDVAPGQVAAVEAAPSTLWQQPGEYTPVDFDEDEPDE